MTKKAKVFIAILGIFFIYSFSLIKAEVVDKILVIINDEIITQGDVDRILVNVYNKYKVQYTGKELSERIDAARKDLLNTLIQDRLLLSEAKRKKIEVDEKEVKVKMEEARSQFSSEGEFRNALLQDNITLGELESKYRERIMRDKLMQEEIRGKITVTPQEVVEFYNENRKKFIDPEKLKLNSILIRISDERPREEALTLAKTILTRLEEGGDFSLLAKEYSDGPYASASGDMGWVRRGELMARINDIIFNLDSAEISGIIETKLGFHIFKVDEKVEPSEMTFHEVKNKIEDMLYNQKVNVKLGTWIEKLKEDAYIAFR